VLGLSLGLAVQFIPLQSAQAGRTCDNATVSVPQMESSLKLAEKIHQQLEEQFAKAGTQAVVIARVGQDLSKYQLRYSHLGIAYRMKSADGSSAGWRIVHKLNECGSPVASLYRHGLADFFLDNLHAYEASWVALKPSLQKQLIAAIESGTPMTQLHEPNYNMLSYPWSTRYQQSNQWVLELIAFAEQNLGGPASRQSAQYWLRAANYQPTTLNIGPLTRLGGMTRANITFDDHPNERRFGNKIATVTVDSMFQWLTRTGLGTNQFYQRL
jgi:hypothetical protein